MSTMKNAPSQHGEHPLTRALRAAEMMRTREEMRAGNVRGMKKRATAVEMTICLGRLYKSAGLQREPLDERQQSKKVDGGMKCEDKLRW